MASTLNQEGNIDIKYVQGLVKFSIQLPSRKEKCQFLLKSTTNTIFNLIHDLKLEDKGIDRVVAFNIEKERLARNTPLFLVLQNDFYLYINDIKYYCKAPSIEFLSPNQISDLSNIKNAISHLYNSLNVEQFLLSREHELQNKLNDLKNEVTSFESLRSSLEGYAHRRTRGLTWLCLVYMGLQFGCLARLTWFEYSWDIMEPVTYFVGYGTGIVFYIYYLLTRQEFILPQVYKRELASAMHKGAVQKHLDIKRYNTLKDTIYELEHDLNRVRDPLQMNLPLQLQRL